MDNATPNLMQLLRGISAISAQAGVLVSQVEDAQRVVRGLTAEAMPAFRPDTAVEALARRWRAHPYARTGAWHNYDLLCLGRITDPQNPGRMMFPEMRDKILALQNPDGSVGSPVVHPYVNFVLALSFAVTVLQWNRRAFAAHARRTLDYALNEYRRLAKPPFSGIHQPYGKYYQHTGFFGKWIVPPYYCALLFEHHDVLTAEQRAEWAPYADVYLNRQPVLDYASVFDGDFGRLHLGECLPQAALFSAEADAHAQNEAHMPGFDLAYAARRYEVTRDARALGHIQAVLPRMSDGLRPGSRLQEAGFALRYLMKGGVDVLRYFKPEVDYVVAHLYHDGAPVDAHSTDRDLDGSALAKCIANSLGLRTSLATSYLDYWWNPDKLSYQSLDGLYTFTTSMVVMILEAFLHDAELPYAAKRSVWQRTIHLLDTRPWLDILNHMSPLFLWENVITVLFRNEHLFPEDTTRLHYAALEQVLRLQQADGGFLSCHTGHTNLEETALALLAFKSVLSCPIDATLRATVTAAAQRAERFLTTTVRRGYDPNAHLDLWIAKFTFAPVNIIEAMLVGALHRPIPSAADIKSAGSVTRPST